MSARVEFQPEHIAILAYLAGQPDGGCRLNWLPDTINWKAYLALRSMECVVETAGRGGFLDVTLTDKGRRVLTRYEKAKA